MSKALNRLAALLAALIFVEGLNGLRPALGSTAAICDAAAVRASRESGVPLDVLRAISLTETGRKRDGAFKPWPWTVNMEGKGVWFDSPSEALAYVEKHFDRGARSFDVGCFQINYRWHGKAFASINDMFDPNQNAAYAAKFLNELFAEFGNWSKAAGAYHSRTPKFANRYTDRFNRIRAAMGDVSEPTLETPAQKLAEVRSDDARINRYPLLQMSSGEAQLGSLVSLPRQPTGQSLFSSDTPTKGFLQ